MTKSKRKHDDFEQAFWGEETTPVVREEPIPKSGYDLEERTARFGEAVIDLAKAIPQNAVTNRIITQLVGAGTSVGANYVEADDAVSKKEFLKSIGICKKETREVKHFLRMIVRAVPELKTQARKLWLEARESNDDGMNNPQDASANSFVIRALSFVRHSSFVIRHCSYVL
jgi:four helix bundle protein